MSSLSFPDIDVWLAIAASEHFQAGVVRRWREEEGGRIAFSRMTHMGFLRVMTASAAMGGKPLTMVEAWYLPEPAGAEARFREFALNGRLRRLAKERPSSPKLWADAWLLAFAAAAGGAVVTFDRALVTREAKRLLRE